MTEHIIEFPNLFSGGIKVSRVIVNVFGIDLYWYGVLITLGVILGVFYALKRAKEFGMVSDYVFDTVFISAIGGFIGARAYYCIFRNLELGGEGKYTLITAVTEIRDGGLAIYGGIIGSVAVCLIYTRLMKYRVLPVLDLAGLSLPIGQTIGRWGNFFNQEAYGAATADNLPWGMTGDIIAADPAVGNGLVHPCFLYESLWCAAGFLILHLYSKKLMTFDGEIFLLYVVWYGSGRSFIEILRTDSLYAGELKISQVVGILTAVAALGLYMFFKLKSGHVRYRDTDASKAAIYDYGQKILLRKEQAAAAKAFAKEAKNASEPSEESSDKEDNDDEQSQDN